MTRDSGAVQERGTVQATEELLASMMARLKEIVGAPLTQHDLVEITSIYNNVAYIFLYLEANEEHVNYDALLPWRDAFHRNRGLDEQVLALVEGLRCDDREAEQSRLAYIAQLRDKLAEPDDVGEAVLGTSLEDAKDVLSAISQDQSALLSRLGAAGSGGNPAARFYTLLSSTQSAATRAKLNRAWALQVERHVPALLTNLEDLVARRRQRAVARGFTSVLDETLRRCQVNETAVEEFLHSFMEEAIKAYLPLEATVSAAVGVTDRPMDHFGFFMRQLTAGAVTPRFGLEKCLALIFSVADQVFGIRFERLPSANDQVIIARGWRGTTEVGVINFDLWQTGTLTKTSNHTRGLRNRTDWSGLVQRPIAYVSCRFQRSEQGADQITFQNVHSLFHEFGHALNHLLIRKRISNQSGLEYLPLERLEYFSMWFEKWVYHSEFGQQMGVGSAEPDAIRLCQKVKRLEYQRTYVERAVTALLDFEVARRADGGLEDAFDVLDRRFHISRYCALDDLLAYFTWPMFTANPGANFAYLMGASYSCEQFAVFEGMDLDEVESGSDVTIGFAECLDYDLPTVIPGTGALFEFYGVATETPLPLDQRA